MANSVNSHGVETADDNSSHHLQSPEVDEKNKNILRNLIHQQLDEIRTGNAYVEHELNSDCFSKLLVDNDIYSKFEVMTAKKWMDVDLMSNHECGLNGGKLNKKRKQYVTAIKAVSDFVRMEIEQYTASAADGDTHHAAEEDTVSSLSESKVSSTSQRQKKKSKKSKKERRDKKDKKKDKKKSKKSKKRKRGQDSEVEEGSDSDTEEIESRTASLADGAKQNIREEEKAKFEKERSEILSKVPDRVKNQFRQLGFAKWGKDVLPVMFLGPYDVAPGSVRDTWMKMVKNIKNNKTSMSRLVFWYGTTEENMAAAYSFIPEKSTFTYEQGCSKGYDKIPDKLQKKLDTGKKLTDNETLIIDGLEQLKNDANQPAEERIPWIFDFEEEYEMDDVLEVSAQIEEKVKKKVVAKSKKNKKKKLESDDDSKLSSKKKKNKKRKRDPDEKSESSKKKALNHSKKLDEEIMEEVAEEDAFLQEEAPSEDDSFDDDFSVENGSDSDEDDELYDEKPKKAQPKKKAKPGAKQVKNQSKIKRKDKANAQNITSEPERKKNKKTEQFDREQLRFEECERIFLPLISKLEVEDIEQKITEKHLKRFFDEVDRLVPSFIEEYSIGIVIKHVRKRYKTVAHLNDLCRSITAKMKSVYKIKKDSEPDGFKPKVKKKPMKKEKKKQPQAQPIQREKSIVKKEQSDDVLHREKNHLSKKQQNNISTLSPKRNSPKPSETDQSRQELVSKELSVPKKSISDVPDSSTKETETTKNEKVKSSSVKKKPFSLQGIFERPNRPSTNGAGKGANKETMKENDRPLNKETTKLPTWIMNYHPTARKTTSNNIDRELAMDFLDAAVTCLPKEKIDPRSVALALEDALYTEYESDAEKYWERVHYISAAMARKKELGQMAQKIISGVYASPNDVIQETEIISWESLKAHYFF